MGLLDSVLGSLVGGGASPMGGVLSSLLGGGQQGGMGMTHGGMGGGLGSLVSQFELAGLDYVAQPWVGNGAN